MGPRLLRGGALAGLMLALCACTTLAAQQRERGRDALEGTWRVVRYDAPDVNEVSGTLAFDRDGTLVERLVFGEGRDAERRARTRRYRLVLGEVPGSYALRLDGRQRVEATFTPAGRLVLLVPAEVGSGWARAAARIELARAQG